jgi:hypothetical protein
MNGLEKAVMGSLMVKPLNFFGLTEKLTKKNVISVMAVIRFRAVRVKNEQKNRCNKLLDIKLDATDFCYNSIVSNAFLQKKIVYVKYYILSCPTKLLSTHKENIPARQAIDAHAQGFVGR